jgi:hypothetical protein
VKVKTKKRVMLKSQIRNHVEEGKVLKRERNKEATAPTKTTTTTTSTNKHKHGESVEAMCVVLERFRRQLSFEAGEEGIIIFVVVA